uniref:Uncharacterized protein n=1 Tax=Kalanchoe fedtschenkoi TaxID=63787 RepID=A0A7N0VDX2_KALFE
MAEEETIQGRRMSLEDADSGVFDRINNLSAFSNFSKLLEQQSLDLLGCLKVDTPISLPLKSEPVGVYFGVAFHTPPIHPLEFVLPLPSPLVRNLEQGSKPGSLDFRPVHHRLLLVVTETAELTLWDVRYGREKLFSLNFNIWSQRTELERVKVSRGLNRAK